MSEKKGVNFASILAELEKRVKRLTVLCNNSLSTICRHFCAILLVCENQFNKHFAENALTLFTFVGFEIEALTFGYLPIEGQERYFKGFISKQSGSFSRDVVKSNKKDTSVRLTSCCVEYLNLEADSDNDLLNQIDVQKSALRCCIMKLQSLGEDVVSALHKKNRGSGGYKFKFNVKFYGGFIYSSECSANQDKQGIKIPTVSDGLELLRYALDYGQRDLYVEIEALMITPHPQFSHWKFVLAENALIESEIQQRTAHALAVARRNSENEIIAKKKDDEKKRKREEAQRKAADLARDHQSTDESSVSASEKVVAKKSAFPKKKTATIKDQKSISTSSRQDSDNSSGDDNDCDLDDDGYITLDNYVGDRNDVEHLQRAGRQKASSTGDLDITRDSGYEDMDEDIVKHLRGNLIATKNYVLRGGQVSASELASSNRGLKSHPKLSSQDKEWSESDRTPPRRESQLNNLSFDGCEGPEKSKKYLHSNSIDVDTSSGESDGIRDPNSKSKLKKSRKTTRKSTRKTKSAKPKSRAASESSCSSDGLSSDSSVPKRKRNKKVPKTEGQHVVAAAADAVGNDGGGDTKSRKTREAFGLTEQQLIQYANVNLVPFQVTAAQHQDFRHELFEVDGKFLSEEEIKNLILDDVDVLSKNIDAKFLSFLRQHIMVDVFKDVHFISNVIQFYRMKRSLHNTGEGEHITCVWQEVLSEVSNDLIDQLVASNEKILNQMDKNLLDMKELRRQKRHESRLIIGSDEEVARLAEDLDDLLEYKKQMKLNKKSLEDIEKVMKRRINTLCHTLAAKITCIWAKLNNFQHLLRGNMSKFEKKFLLDPSMPFYSVLNDDLSRKWGNVATSPSSLFQGIDMAGSNNTHSRANLLLSDRVVEMDADENDVIEEEPILRSSALLSRVRFQNDESVSASCDSSEEQQQILVVEEDTAIQQDDDYSEEHVQESSADLSFLSPAAASSLSGGQSLRPKKVVVYNSAMLSSSHDDNPLSSPDSQVSADCNELSSSDGGRLVSSSSFASPVLVTTSNKRSQAGRFSVSRALPGSSSSYLSSAVSTDQESCSSGSSPDNICTSNAAVLFDELKKMSQDQQTVDSMKRFIAVMNEKPSNVKMPATKEEEDKILAKATIKKKRADAKLAAAAAEGSIKAAAVLSSTVSTFHDDAQFLLVDEDATGTIVVRQKTDSYLIFQKLFLFICKKHIEVKDSIMNLQIFGQRLVRSLSNSVLLKFLQFILRHRKLSTDHLPVYLMDEKSIFAEFRCSFGIAYKANDYFNIRGDGYCVMRSMFALLSNAISGYKLSVASMKEADRVLFTSSKSRREFYHFLHSTRESISTHCNDEATKLADKKKLRTVMTLFGAFPQLKQVPAAYWACLDWVSYAAFNCTAFSTNYSDCVPGYAQLHCSSTVRRDMSSTTIGLVPYSLDEIYRVLSEPATPNFCVLEGQHAFVVKSPAKEDIIKSFKGVLGLFLGACQQNISVLGEKHENDFLTVDTILEKMIADNFYALNETEAILMTSILRGIERLDGVGVDGGLVVAAAEQCIVLCGDDAVPCAITLEDFCGSRDGEGVIDLCDSDTGDVDRVKARKARATLARSEREVAELKIKLEAMERENSFLLRLIAKDSELFYDPPVDIITSSEEE